MKKLFSIKRPAGERQAAIGREATILVFLCALGLVIGLASCEYDPPEITSVTITTMRDATWVEKGGSLHFYASVAGYNAYSRAVTWSITTSGIASGTSIDSKGLLTVASEESNATLVIQATSQEDISKSDTKTVTVVASDHVISSATISGITAPAIDSPLVTTITAQAHTTVSVKWVTEDAPSTEVTGNAAAGKRYIAVVTMTPAEGYFFAIYVFTIYLKSRITPAFGVDGNYNETVGSYSFSRGIAYSLSDNKLTVALAFPVTAVTQ